MALVVCPECGSDDVERDAGSSSDETITIRCISCEHRFTREPDVTCRRCHSRNIAAREYVGWAFDDPDDARENPKTASWSSHDRVEFRCIDCNLNWRASGPSRPYTG